MYVFSIVYFTLDTFYMCSQTFIVSSTNQSYPKLLKIWKHMGMYSPPTSLLMSMDYFASPEITEVNTCYRQTNSLTQYMGGCRFFLQFKFATSILASLVGGLLSPLPGFESRLPQTENMKQMTYQCATVQYFRFDPNDQT